jgi:hypothetical protein
MWFDCQGRFRDQTGPGISPTQYAPPRSIAARLSAIACLGAKDTHLEDVSQPEPKETPAQYCTGFSPAACARITAAAATNPKPRFCKPGFGVAGSGLSPQQIRICSVITNEEVRIEDIAKQKSTGGKYNVTVSATRSNFPGIVGSTKLPDGTKLLVSINKPRLPTARELLAAGLPMCEDNCIPASGPQGHVLGVPTVVLAGAFSAGPFSWAGKPFRPGAYEVEVYLVSLPGENFTGGENFEKQSERMKKPILTTSVTVAPQQP